MLRPALTAALTAALILGGAGLATTASAQATGDAATATETAPVTIPDMAQGAEDAPVTIVEYGSFTCPHCADFHADQYQQLKRDYIDTGKVRFVFREVYFDRFGLWASMIARCGGEMRFFGISDLLYDQQRDWIGDQQPQTIADNLRRLGLSAGLDEATLDACLKDEATAEALVAWYQENAARDGIESTPTFLINGEKHSNMAYDDLKAIVDAEIAEAAQ
ncbi:DsbA family protein [Rubellimicrobium aerolatum]|uniref:DsbA family protein n=1 Tax=Rubellimicrobium aerolatum TaxID=490979 RepID=A0ABW0SA96_9RHOB|nr:DsbA family protein [Rubellimicrobium aerolatum]MBP1805276.1 protein-disulfide isomerase [Rubellimicrobium aerolatum]